MTNLNLTALRIQLGGLIAALVLAIGIVAGIAAGAFVLSFHVLRDLGLQGMLPASLTWIFPAIVDGAILGATIGAVVLNKITGPSSGRTFFLGMLISVVIISVTGNGYHAFRAAEQARALIAAGGDLGFTPLHPLGAAAITIISPLLVLAFTHGVGILIAAIGTSYSEYRTMVAALGASDATTPPAAPHDATADTHSSDTTIGEVVHNRRDADSVAPVADAVAMDADNVAAVAHDDTAVADAPVAAVAYDDAPRGVVAHDRVEQTVDALLEFIEQAPGLSENVRTTARLKITDPSMTFAAIAEVTGRVAASTALRRYQKAEAAASAAGFTMPPLPDLGETAYTDRDDDLDTIRELVHS